MGSSNIRDLSSGEVEELIRSGGIKRVSSLGKVVTRALGYKISFEDLKALIDQTKSYFTNGYRIGDRAMQDVKVQSAPTKNWVGGWKSPGYVGSSSVVHNSATGISPGAMSYGGLCLRGRIRD
jgi:hypothetical protein